MSDATAYKEPAEFGRLLFEALRSDANPDQRDAAAQAVCAYMIDVLERLDDLEDHVSNAPEPLDTSRLQIVYKP